MPKGLLPHSFGTFIPRRNEPADMRGLADWMFTAEDYLLSQSEDVDRDRLGNAPKVA